MQHIDSSQDKRLKLIDFYLYFIGKVNRSDLINHCDIAIASASRSFIAYKKNYPNNMIFNETTRAYIKTETFKPAFQHEPETALRLIAWGEEIRTIPVSIYGEKNISTVLESLSTEIIAEVTRAILNRHCISIQYSSCSSTKERIIAPHSLFRGLGAWHIRAWDSERKTFVCFRLNRILKAEQKKCSERKSAKEDIVWNAQVVLSVAPHSKHENKNLVIDLGMQGKHIRNIHTNEVLAGYLLNDLRVDCTPDFSLPPQAFNLQLMNRHELEHIESIQTLVVGFGKR